MGGDAVGEAGSRPESSSVSVSSPSVSSKCSLIKPRNGLVGGGGGDLGGRVLGMFSSTMY